MLGKWATVVNRALIRGLPQLFPASINRLQCFSATVKRDQFEYWKRPLLIAHIMENGDMCAPKGPRMHAMSPPLRVKSLTAKVIPCQSNEPSERQPAANHAPIACLLSTARSLLAPRALDNARHRLWSGQAARPSEAPARVDRSWVPGMVLPGLRAWASRTTAHSTGSLAGGRVWERGGGLRGAEPPSDSVPEAHEPGERTITLTATSHIKSWRYHHPESSAWTTWRGRWRGSCTTTC